MMSARRVGTARHAEGQAGFGLLEMTIASAILGLLMAGVFTMLFRSQTTFELQLASMDIRQQARVSLDMISTELRMAGYRMDNLTEAIMRGGPNVLQLVGDIDDSDVALPCGAAYETAADGGAERLTYAVSNGQMLRTLECWDGSSWTVELNQQVIASNLIATAVFRFFDEDGAELVPAGTELSSAQRDEVRLVTIDLSLLDPDDPLQGQAPEFDLAASVRLPNVE